jgi:hypothetical protein
MHKERIFLCEMFLHLCKKMPNDTFNQTLFVPYLRIPNGSESTQMLGDEIGIDTCRVNPFQLVAFRITLWNAALFSVQISNDAAQLNPVGVIDSTSVCVVCNRFFTSNSQKIEVD